MTIRRVLFIEATSTGTGESLARICDSDPDLSAILATSRPATLMFESVFDTVVECNTSDSKAVLDLARREAPAAVLTSHDEYVSIVASVCDALGLPSIGSSASAFCDDKLKMRRTLERHCPEFNVTYAKSADGMSRPIRKPRVGNDSEGVRTVLPGQTLEHDENFFFEETIFGQEYSVTVAVQHGRVVWVVPVLKSVEEIGSCEFLKIGARLPADIPEVDLRADMQRLARCLKLESGMVDVDLKAADGQLMILEVNGRLAGDQICSSLIPESGATDPSALAIALALGDTIPPLSQPSVPLALHRAAPMVRSRFRGFAPPIEVDLSGLVSVVEFCEVGQVVEASQSTAGVVGSVLCRGNTLQEAVSRARTFATFFLFDEIAAGGRFD